jgi:hypothetical protein
MVERLVVMDGGEHPKPDSNQYDGEHGVEPKLERGGQALADRLEDGLLRDLGPAEIALKDLFESIGRIVRWPADQARTFR